MSATFRLLGIDVYRYGIVPAYYVLLLASTTILTKMIVSTDRKNTRSVIGFLLLVIMLTLGLYSGLQDPHRAPWNGSLRLAPVTYSDRIELVPVAIYSAPHVKVLGWHDVYIPRELTNAKIEGVTPYYLKHQLLLKVAKGNDITNIIASLNKNAETYFILRREILMKEAYKNYNLVFIANEHLLLIRK
jgi:hypothetical protein